MHTDIIDLINAIREANERDTKQRTSKTSTEAYNITISRSCSSRGREIAQQLANKLNLRLYDKEIIEEVSREAGRDRYIMEHIDQHFDDKDDWLTELFSDRKIERNLYQRNLVKVIISAARVGGIFIGRGANYILAKKDAFRVRIVGSVQQCAQDYAQEFNVPLDQACKHVEQTNLQRANFIRKIFGNDINDLLAYDIGINTDQFDVNQATKLIIKGFHLTQHHKNNDKE